MHLDIACTRLLQLFIGLALAGLLLWLLLHDQDISKVVLAIHGINMVALVLSLAFVAASHAIRIVRWWWMLRPLSPGIRLGACIVPYLMSIAVNNLVPLRAGDAYRVLGFRKQLNTTGSQVLGTLISERLLDLFILSSFLLVGLYGLADDVLPKAIVGNGIVIAFTVIGLSLGGVVLFPWLRQLLVWMGLAHISDSTPTTDAPRFLEGKGTSAGRTHCGRLNMEATVNSIKNRRGRILQLVEALDTLRRPAVAFPLLCLSLLSWSFSAGIYTVIAFAITDSVSAQGAWFALSTGNFGTLLPGAPASVGTFDYFAALGLIAYGATRASAVAFAFTMHIVLWVPTTLAGAVCFLWRILHPLTDGHFVGSCR